LHGAAIGNYKDIVELLINNGAGANVNARDKSGNTPLYYASTFGWGSKRNKNDWDIARSLVSNGAEVNMKPGSDDTPLHSAALYAAKGIVRLFLDNGADVKLASSGWPRKPNSGPAPLHNACMRADKDAEVVELIIAAGADINSKCYSEQADGWTPLYFACLHENTKAVELLIAKGAKINPISDLGNTPMHVVTNTEIVEILIDNRANFHFKNKEGFSPLHNAVKGGHSDLAKLLIAKRADVTVTNNQGTSLLHEAAITKQKEMIELLIAEGVNVNAKDKAGMTAAQQAEKSGHYDIADFLCNYNAK
jgi:cytohesin